MTSAVSGRALPSLVPAGAGALRRAAGKRLGAGRGGHATVQEQAAEVLEARHGGLGHHVASDGRGRLAAGPELLGDGGEARPYGVLQVATVDGLAPHLALPAQDLLARRVVHAAARLVDVDVLPVDLEVVEVPG